MAPTQAGDPRPRRILDREWAARRARPRHLTLLALLATILLGACTSPAPPTGAPQQPETGTAATSEPPEPLEPGSTSRSVSVDGIDRTYRAYRPESLADPAPLILGYHGRGGDAAEMEASTGWDEQAERTGSIVVFPNGLGRSFNAGGCCGQAEGDDIDDVAAALAMIDDVSAAAPVDPDRVYATGFSNGGHMAYRLACETDRFAAIAPVSGARLGSCDDPHQTSLLHIHGLEDSSVPPDGESRPGGVVVPPLEETVSDWRRALNCSTPTESTSDDGDVRRSDAGCADGRAVDLITLETFGHAWPRSGDGLDATEEIARFFAEHHR